MWVVRVAAAGLRGQGTEGEKPLWLRRRGVVPRRGRLCVFHNTLRAAAARALANCLGLAPVSEA